MPVGNILVGDSGGNVEHNDTTFTVDVIPISQSSELLLAGSIPHIELELTEVGEETERTIGKNMSVPSSDKHRMGNKKWLHISRKGQETKG